MDDININWIATKANVSTISDDIDKSSVYAHIPTWEVKLQTFLNSNNENIFVKGISISRVHMYFYFCRRRCYMEACCSYWLRNVKYESLLLIRFVRGSGLITSANVIDALFFGFARLLLFSCCSFLSCFHDKRRILRGQFISTFVQVKTDMAFVIIRFLRSES